MADSTVLEKPLLGCRNVAEAIEALTFLEELRQVEGREIRIICDNPDFEGPQAILTVDWDWDDQNVRFEGDTVLACLRAAKAMRDKLDGKG